jgi:hypothetical protein
LACAVWLLWALLSLADEQPPSCWRGGGGGGGAMAMAVSGPLMGGERARRCRVPAPRAAVHMLHGPENTPSDTLANCSGATVQLRWAAVAGAAGYWLQEWSWQVRLRVIARRLCTGYRPHAQCIARRLLPDRGETWPLLIARLCFT